MTTTAPAAVTCPRCSGPTIGSNEGPFCPRCQTLAADVPPRRTRAVSVGLAEPRRGIQAVTFCLPLPLPGCSKNASYVGHWATKGKAVAAYRAECAALLPTIHVHYRMFKARISMTFYLAPDPDRYHPRDRANAISATAGLVDEIVCHGWLADDSARYLEWGTVELLSTAKEHQGRAEIVVRLEALPC